MVRQSQSPPIRALRRKVSLHKSKDTLMEPYQKGQIDKNLVVSQTLPMRGLQEMWVTTRSNTEVLLVVPSRRKYSMMSLRQYVAFSVEGG